MWTFFNKTVDLLNEIEDIFYGFLSKIYIVDLFNKFMDLLFRKGVLQHVENPPWLRARVMKQKSSTIYIPNDNTGN